MSAPPTPNLVSWNLTRRCNLACGHCYLDAVQRKSRATDELSTVEAFDVVQQIARTGPGAMLVLTGGEPLMRSDLPLLVAEAARLGLMPVIGSNGVLLDEARAHELKEAGAVGVGISLDSVSAGFHDWLRGMPGAWEGALQGMQAARAAGLAVQVQMTLFERNRGELAAMAALARDLGALALNFFFLVCTGRGVTQTDMPQRDYEQTLAQIAQLQRANPELMIRARCAPYMRRVIGLHAGEASGGYADFSSACLAGRSYLRIDPRGQVTPCPYIPTAVGDLRARRLEDLWATGRAFVRLREELPGGKCGDCDFRYSCGGCRARAAAAHGDLMAEDAKCGYVPPPGALPEARPASRALETQVRWSPEAHALLERIPGFVRVRIRERLEQLAQQAARDEITLEFMRANRPASPLLAGVRRPQP